MKDSMLIWRIQVFWFFLCQGVLGAWKMAWADLQGGNTLEVHITAELE